MFRTLAFLALCPALVGHAQLVLKSGATASATTNANALYTNGRLAIGGLANGTLPTAEPSHTLLVTGSARISNRPGIETIELVHQYAPSMAPALLTSLRLEQGQLRLAGTLGASSKPWGATYGYTGMDMQFSGNGLRFVGGVDGDGVPRLSFSTTATTARKFVLQATGALNTLALATNGTDRISILPSGNVAVGTPTTPWNLEVAGSCHKLGNFGLYSEGTGTTSLSLNAGPDHAGSQGWGHVAASAGHLGKVALGSDGTLYFSSTEGRAAAGQFVPVSDLKTRMVLTGAGRLGIATASPAEKVHVNLLGGNMRFDCAAGDSPGKGAQENTERIYIGRDNRMALSFIPTTANNEWFHIHHTLGNALQVSTGPYVGTNPLVTFRASGQVVVGGKVPASNAYGDHDAKLVVVGKIVAREVVAMADDASWKAFPDYVFDKGYPLMSLDSLRGYIDTHRHLPEIPSAREVAEQGLSLSALAVQQMKKIEELTLYLLEQQRQIDTLRQEVRQLKKQ